MGNLIVWTFDTPGGADEAADVLVREADDDLVPALETAATVSWSDEAASPRTRHLPRLGGADPDGGAFWGLLLGLVFYVPLLGAAVGAPTGAVSGALRDVGIDDAFVNRVRDRVTPGTSALFALTSGPALDRLHDLIGRAGTTDPISFDLAAEQHAAVRRVFGV